VRITIELGGYEIVGFANLMQFLTRFPLEWENLMSLIEDVKAALMAEEDKIQAVAAYLGDLSAKLDAMKDAPTTEQVQEILAMVNTHQAELQAMVPVPPPAPPEEGEPGSQPETPPEGQPEGQ
jgi:hypothetical protein